MHHYFLSFQSIHFVLSPVDVKIIMPLALAAYWVLNLPVGYLCGFTLGLGPWGLFIGYFVGLTTAAVLYLLRIRRDVRMLRQSGSVRP